MVERLASDVKGECMKRGKEESFEKRALEPPALQAKVVTKMCHFALQFPPMFAVPPFTFFSPRAAMIKYSLIQFRPN